MKFESLIAPVYVVKKFANKFDLEMYSFSRLIRCKKTITSLTLVVMCMVVVMLMFIIKYYRNLDNYYTEEMRKQCGLSVCTPCQDLDPSPEGDVKSGRSNDTLKVIHKKQHFSLVQFSIPILVNRLEYLPNSGEAKLEKNIHQSWKRTHIPIQFRNYVRSFVINHPSWNYVLWTDASIRKFLIDIYPNFVSLYDSYTHPLNRPDVMRYIILFHYGGVYSDLDVQSLHPLDPMIKKYTCFLGQEPHVHSIVYNNFFGQASNALMACKKQHPFMKLVIENLYQFHYFADVLDSTGPRFLTFSFRQYIRIHKYLKRTEDNYVYLAPPEYFLPTVDPAINKRLEYQCQNSSCLSALRKWQCDQWKRQGIQSDPLPFSFTNHVWFHTTDHILQKQEINIFEIYPNTKIYGKK